MNEIKYFQRRLSTLKNDRAKFEPLWKQVRKVFLPSAGNLNDDGNRTQAEKNLERYQELFNSTGVLAVERLANGMVAGLTSPTRHWFRVGIEDPTVKDLYEVQDWLYKVDNFLRTTFLKSNVYRTLTRCYLECSTFGQFAFMVDDDEDTVIHCVPFTVGEYYISSSTGKNVDIIYREFDMTVEQVIEKFGYEQASENTQIMYDNKKFDNLVRIVHAVEPNRNQKKTIFDKKFISVYYEQNCKDRFLSEGGYNRLPVIAPRWDDMANTEYGNCPSYRALSDALMLQALQEEKIKAVQLANDPPKEASGTMINQEVALTPGATFYTATGQETIRPLNMQSIRLSELEGLIQQTEMRLKENFYNDLFLIIANAGKNMTATEVNERMEEKYLMLGAVIDRMQTELLQPLIDVTLEIASEQGKLPEPPEVLNGKEYKVEYISFLAQAQKAVGTRSITSLMQFVGSVASFDPNAIDRIDVDQAIDEYAEAVGSPPPIMRSEEELNAIRQQRAMAQQEEREAMRQQQNVENMRSMAEINLNEANPINEVLGSIGAGGL